MVTLFYRAGSSLTYKYRFFSSSSSSSSSFSFLLLLLVPPTPASLLSEERTHLKHKINMDGSVSFSSWGECPQFHKFDLQEAGNRCVFFLPNLARQSVLEITSKNWHIYCFNVSNYRQLKKEFIISSLN